MKKKEKIRLLEDELRAIQSVINTKTVDLVTHIGLLETIVGNGYSDEQRVFAVIEARKLLYGEDSE